MGDNYTERLPPCLATATPLPNLTSPPLCTPPLQFEDIGHSGDARKELAKYVIGELKITEEEKKKMEEEVRRWETFVHPPLRVEADPPPTYRDWPRRPLKLQGEAWDQSSLSLSCCSPSPDTS